MMKVLPFLLGTVISATGSFANNELLYDNVSREIGESVPAHSLTYSPQTSPARVEGQSVEFSYCQDPETAYNLSSRGMTKDTYLWIAFEIPVEEQQAYLGNQISAVNFMTGTTSGYTWPTGLEYMIYVTDDLSVLPTFDRMLSQNVAFNYNTCNLKTPFTITGEKPVYVGYRIKLKNASQASSLYVLPVDGIPTDNKSTLYYMTTDKTAVPVFKSSRGVYQNWAPEMGSVCLQALVTGDNLPKALAKPTGITMTNYFNTSTKLKYELDVKNFGTEPISSLVVRSVVDNGTNYDRTVTVSPAIESGAVGTVTVQNVPNAAVGQYTLSSTILKVNGVDVPTEMQKTVTAEYSCYDNGWARQIVIEEGTGVKCSWCPRGIVMMEYIKEHYPDWIRIAVHGAFGLDPMTADTYVPMIYDYLPGAPTAVANRYAEVTVGGADDQYYAPVNEFFTSFPAYADVTFSAQCSDDDSKVKVVATSEFEFTPSVEHRLAFALVEDNVGPYDQANAYARWLWRDGRLGEEGFFCSDDV